MRWGLQELTITRFRRRFGRQTPQFVILRIILRLCNPKRFSNIQRFYSLKGKKKHGIKLNHFRRWSPHGKCQSLANPDPPTPPSCIGSPKKPFFPRLPDIRGKKDLVIKHLWGRAISTDRLVVIGPPCFADSLGYPFFFESQSTKPTIYH